MEHTEQHRLVDALRALLSERCVPAGDATDQAAHDWLGRSLGQPLCVARPANTAEVQTLVRFACEHDLVLVPQGGNTGLVGGSIPHPDSHARSIIVQLGRLSGEPVVDAVNGTVSVEAGVVLEHLQETLAEHGLYLPMHLGSGGSAQIGGLISTNAGGSHVLRYGMMSDLVLGLEVVLPDGQLWRGDRALRKDNTGYALRRLFCGAEGTLGIITRAVLRTVALPNQRATLLFGFESLAAAADAGAHIRRDAGDVLSALEFMGETGIELVRNHVPETVIPWDSVPVVTLLVELDTASSLIPLQDVAERLAENTLDRDGFVDGLLAMNESQRDGFWALREAMPEAQRRLGQQLKHDVAVPVSALPVFVQQATEALHAIDSELIVSAYGHLGDGNVHFNLSPGVSGFRPSSDALRRTVYDLCGEHAGSISAEHGLGQDKRGLAEHYSDAMERDLMRAVKRALDPVSRLNPGKLV